MPNRRTAIHSTLFALSLLLSAPILALSRPVFAQKPMATQPSAATAPSPDLAGIAHVALRVNNLDASVAFYRSLGFVRAFALSRNGQVYEAFIKLDDRQFIELYPVTEKNPQTGFLHLCYEGDNLQSVHAYYVEHGLTPKPLRTAGAGNLLFTMPGPLTPTGPQNMEYTQYMPGSLHSKDFGHDLGTDRIADKLVSVTLAVDDPAAAAAFYASKVGFVASGPGTAHSGRIFALPGTSHESIDLVPANTLGFKARFSLELAPGMGATALRTRGIPFQAIGHALILHDPDGNEIRLTSRP